MKKILLGSALLGTLAFTACNSNTRPQDEGNDTMADYVDTTHTSQNSLDWQGTYEGTVPCADCPGIKTTVVLDDDGTFKYSAEYLERDVVAVDSGSFMWHNNGSTVHLLGQDIDLKYQVGENRLFQLDMNGEKITGELADNYILQKTQ